MIEEKISVGKLLRLGGLATKIAVKDDVFNFQTPRIFTMDQSTSSGYFKNKVKTAGVTPGEGAVAKRNFNFLTYYPGFVTETLANVDVLTGKMSGCWVMLYKDQGMTKVCHVGTHDQDEQKSIAAKNVWMNWARSNPTNIIGGFNPMRYWNQQGFPPKSSHTDSRGVCYALVTSGKLFFTIFMYEQSVAERSVFRVAGVEKIQSFPPSALLNI